MYMAEGLLLFLHSFTLLAIESSLIQRKCSGNDNSALRDLVINTSVHKTSIFHPRISLNQNFVSDIWEALRLVAGSPQWVFPGKHHWGPASPEPGLMVRAFIADDAAYGHEETNHVESNISGKPGKGTEYMDSG